MQAARVGSEGSSDRRRAAGRQVDAVTQPGRVGVLLQDFEGHPRAGDRRAGSLVYRVEPGEPGCCQDDLGTVCPIGRPGHRATDQARVAALRYDRDPVHCTQAKYLRDLRGGSRSNHGRSRSRPPAGPVGFIRSAQRRVREYVTGAQRVAE